MQDVFVGRSTELSTLSDLLGKATASLVVIKGRRRIGKTRLIEEFTQNKKTFMIRGLAPNDSMTAQSQRDEFARQLSITTGLPEIKADDWSKLFLLLYKEARSGRIIIVLDEVSWMGSKDPNFMAKLKDIWDTYFKKNNKLMLILCGSISTWIDENIINSTGFYGRISWVFNLQPLSLIESNSLLDSHGFRGSPYEILKVLSVTGGVPWYLEQIQGRLCADENILRQCFMPGGVLVSEYDRIFKELFGNKDILYRKIVGALLNGSSTYEDLANDIDYKSSGRFSLYLDNLVQSGFIVRDYKWNISKEKKSKISRFRLKDNYLRFYLKYIEPNRDKIEESRVTLPLSSSLPGWDSMMGLQFENLVVNNRNLLINLLNIQQHDILYDNPYFQRKTEKNKGCQIDYLLQTRYKNIYLFEIKFSRNPIDTSVIDQVKQKINAILVPRNMVVLPILVHVNGVTESLLDQRYFHSIIDFSDLLK